MNTYFADTTRSHAATHAMQGEVGVSVNLPTYDPTICHAAFVEAAASIRCPLSKITLLKIEVQATSSLARILRDTSQLAPWIESLEVVMPKEVQPKVNLSEVIQATFFPKLKSLVVRVCDEDKGIANAHSDDALVEHFLPHLESLSAIALPPSLRGGAQPSIDFIKLKT
jgi:hypothetical protein